MLLVNRISALGEKRTELSPPLVVTWSTESAVCSQSNGT